MRAAKRPRLFWLIWLGAGAVALAQEALPHTEPLTLTGDLSAQMVAGIDRFLTRATAQSLSNRQAFWHRDFSSAAAYENSVEPNRSRLRQIIGAVDARVPATGFEIVCRSPERAPIAETDAFQVCAVRWPVFEDVFGEGLWLRPKHDPVARIVAIPDADQTPEMVVGLAPGLPPERQFARRLAENGCEVIVPVLIDRQDTWSGNAATKRFTNQPHREWIYRQAFTMSRHIIGYEVQKVLAAIDALELTSQKSKIENQKFGVAGYTEGGLVAFYAAALDRRISAALVSGYFDSRQNLWEEPIYRNGFGLLRGFGDAEIASLIAPRSLIVEHGPVPKVTGPPAPREGRTGAAPGRLQTPDYTSVETEFDRAQTLVKAGAAREFDHLTLITGTEGMTSGPGSDRALTALLNALAVPVEQVKQPGESPTDLRTAFDPAERQRRQVNELENHTQDLLRASERARKDFFWNQIKARSPEEWEAGRRPFQTIFWEDVLGRLPPPTLPANPRSRAWTPAGLVVPTNQISRSSAAPLYTNWTGYEVVLDVYPDIFAWGYLLVPKNLRPGEHRPAVVCQHGLSGLPEDTVTQDPENPAFKYYKGFAARLANEGFVVFAPHNPYRGDSFRQLQRKANPLGLSLFSFIIAQHSRILDWLSELPFVDPRRIGFYGLSYGGTTAMRVPAVLDRYALVICSGNFNEWIRKNASPDAPASYLLTGEYEMPEFNLGHTFGHAEMAALIAPRPFMVERGHQDGVGSDEWVAYEYAKVRRLYDQLGIPGRTAIEFFNGGHTINGIGTFEFLHQRLDRPKPEN